MKWIYVSECLYRKCPNGTIYIRTMIDGKRTLRTTETNNPTDAKKVLRRLRDEKWFERYGETLPGPQVRSGKLTVRAVIDAYIKAGFPTKKMGRKAPCTIKKEASLIKPVQEWWASKNPGGLTFADCDAYRDWRASGKYISHFKVHGHQKKRITRGGDRIVDMELQVLCNALNLAVRRRLIRTNPLIGRGRYVCADDVRHCREVAPDPPILARLEAYFRTNGEEDIAECILFMSYSGLRIGEALVRRWTEVKHDEGIIDAKRSKKGIFPWVVITPELQSLLADMERRRKASGLESDLLFPSPFDPSVPRDHSAVRRRLTAACKALGVKHVAPHGLRSFYVTSGREAGLTDAEIAMLIGDKSGPALIASTYGDVRPEHLVRQALRIRFRNDEAKLPQ